MKKTNRIFLIVFCILLTALTGIAGAQQPVVPQPCACLDANGIPYQKGTPGNTLCYQYTKDQTLYLSETLTLDQCAANNAAWVTQQEQLRQLQEAEQKKLAEEAAKQAAAAEEAAKQAAAAEEAAKQAAAAEEAAKQAAAAEEAAKQAAAAEEAAKQAAAAEDAAKQAAAAEEAAKQAAAAEESAKQAAAEEAAKQAAAAEEAAKQAAAAEEAAKQAAAAEEAAKQAAAAEDAAKQASAAEDAAKQAAAAEEATARQVVDSFSDGGVSNLKSDFVQVFETTTFPQLLISSSDSDDGNPSGSSEGDSAPVIPEVNVTVFSPGGPVSQMDQNETQVDLKSDISNKKLEEIKEIPVLEPVMTNVTNEQESNQSGELSDEDPDKSLLTKNMDELLISKEDEKTETSLPANVPVISTEDRDKSLDNVESGDGTDSGTEGGDVINGDDTEKGSKENTEGGNDIVSSTEGGEETDKSAEDVEKSDVKTDDSEESGITEDGVDDEKKSVEDEKKDEPAAGQKESGLTDGAKAELSGILSSEELADADFAWLTADWLDEHSGEFTASVLAELSEIFSLKNKPMIMLKGPAPAVSLEGKLNSIALSKPSEGSTVPAGNVTFEWNYDYDAGSEKTDVVFKLSLSIITAKDSKTYETTVSSVSCADRRCAYTENLSSYPDADVTWYVSGTYGSDSSADTKTSGTQSFKLKAVSPTLTPTPTATPTATPLPKPKAPVQECPKGRYTVRNLGFYWAPSENAEKYLVEWRNDKGQKGSLSLSNTDVTCQNNRCIVSTTLPGTGQYAWTVTAINSSGSARSGEMKFEIAANITTPQAYRPDGTIVNRTYPSFEWEDVRDGAIEYRIQVVGKYDSRIRMDRWYSVKDIYVGKGICYVKTDLFLPAGTYSWRVQARNKDFASGWSSWRDFYVECDYCNYNNVYYNNYANTVPSCSYPVGTITVNKPEFQWRTLTGASYYMVKLLDSSGQTLFENQVSSSNCTIELCKWTPNYTLTKNGNYTWSVAGYGGNGALWNIAYGSFTYQGAAVMKAISYLRPAQNGYLTNEAPVILWTDPGEGAALFHIEIFNNANTLLFSADLNREQAWCDGNTCSIEFKTIPDAENYRITVTPYSEFNTKGDMISLVFSKGGKVLKLSSPKGGAVVSSRPLFRWPLEYSESTSYELILTDAQNNVTTISPLVCGAVGVTCEEGEVFYSPASALPAGTYTVKLAVVGANALSEEVRITVK